MRFSLTPPCGSRAVDVNFGGANRGTLPGRRSRTMFVTSQGVGPIGPEAAHAPGHSPSPLGAPRARPALRAPAWGLLLALVVLLHLAHPLTWGRVVPSLWF